jgi:hypothetical protein
MKKPRKAKSSAHLVPPPFTGALDARLPAENVILAHYVDTAGQWVAASEASDGRVFLGRAKTSLAGRPGYEPWPISRAEHQVRQTAARPKRWHRPGPSSRSSSSSSSA